MKINFNFALVFAFILLSLKSVTAQERSRELFIAARSLTSFNQAIEYKSQFGENRYLRLTLDDLSYSWLADRPTVSNSYPSSRMESSLRMTVGLENRRSLSDHVTFYKGLNVLVNPGINRYSTENPVVAINERRVTTLEVGLGLSAHFGLMTEIKERFILGIHYEPSFGIGIDDNNAGLRYNAFANLGPSQLRLLLGMKWNKKAKG